MDEGNIEIELDEYKEEHNERDHHDEEYVEITFSKDSAIKPRSSEIHQEDILIKRDTLNRRTLLILALTVILLPIILIGGYLSYHFIEVDWIEPRAINSTTPTPAPSPTSSLKGTFFVLSDTHYDMLYSPSVTAKDFCRSDKGPNNFAQTCQEYDSDELDYNFHDNHVFGTFGCDTPYSTMQSMFHHMNSLEQNPDWILILGDISAHCAYSMQHVLNNMEGFFSLLRDFYPTTPVYVTLGNNDVYPHNQLALGPSEMLTQIANLWEKYGVLTPDAISQFRRGGFYSIELPTPDNLKIISLNSLYWFTNWCPQNDTECSDEDIAALDLLGDPMNQLQWLQSQLETSQKANQGVYIFGHVGPQCSQKLKHPLWYEQYSTPFYYLTSQYSETILGLFFAHTHRDSMNLILQNITTLQPYAISSPYEPIPRDEVRNLATILVHSAVTPVDLSNPTFRQTFFDTSTGKLLDYETHYFSLTDVLAYNDATPYWQKEYSFTEAYLGHTLSPDSVFDLYLDMQNRDTGALDLFKYYRVVSTPSAPDYLSVSDEQILCGTSGFCNYLRTCMVSTGINLSKK